MVRILPRDHTPINAHVTVKRELRIAVYLVVTHLWFISMSERTLVHFIRFIGLTFWNWFGADREPEIGCQHLTCGSTAAFSGKNKTWKHDWIMMSLVSGVSDNSTSTQTLWKSTQPQILSKSFKPYSPNKTCVHVALRATGLRDSHQHFVFQLLKARSSHMFATKVNTNHWNLLMTHESL